MLHGGRIEESIEVLKYIVKESDLFLPTMKEKQVNELFESYISKECILGAFVRIFIFIINFSLLVSLLELV